MKTKIFTLFVAIVATTALWASNVITYTATLKLERNDLAVGKNTFGPAITSHKFTNGIGTITCSGEITKIGDWAFYGCKGLISVSIPNSVTTIGDYAFEECARLTSITIPNSVTMIGDRAFCECSSLTSINVDASNTHYSSIDGVLFNYVKDTLIQYPINNTRTEYTIPNSVITIGDLAFSNCSSLTSIAIPNSVTEIGSSAFSGCSGLTSVTIPNSVTTIGVAAFWGCIGLISVTISNSVTEIGNSAFYNCHSLTSIAIPNSVTEIGSSAFYNCSGLTSVTIGNSVTTINSYVFSGCKGLTSITIPNSVIEIGSSVFEGCTSLPVIDNIRYADNYLVEAVDKTLSTYIIKEDIKWIGEYAFENCSNLTSVTIPSSVIKIGDRAFYGCKGLTSITIPNSVIEIGSSVFESCTSLPVIDNIRYADNYLVEAVDKTLSTYIIKEDIKWIGEYAFENCSSLTSVTIPSSVIKIGNRAFYGCKGLTSITIPNSVIEIGSYAFRGCSGLTSVTIPNSVTTIGSGAFANCTGLTSITIPNSVTTIGEETFFSVNNIVYNGIATGSPWGAKCVNGYVDGYLVYSDETKTTLCGCSSAATDTITIPISVTTIGDKAFSDCSSLTSIILENYFTSYNSNSFPSSAKIIYANIITTSLNKKICSVIATMSIPSAYYDVYDEIGLSDRNYASTYTEYYPADENGIIYFDNLSIDLSVYEGLHCYFYAKKGNEYVFNKKDFVEIKGERPTVSCSTSSTQTTITLSNISASTDESVSTLTKGIYYNGKLYEADENNEVILTEIAPNKKCTLQVYGCYNGQYYYGNEIYVTTKSISPTITTSQVAPTSVYVQSASIQGDATILNTTLRCNPTANAPQGEEGYFTGLRPKTKYTFIYEVNTKEGGAYSATDEITTPDLTLTTLTPKVVSAGTAVVAAETNISDYETNVGFEWRKYDAPESMPSKSGAAIICNGVMEGRLLNLGTDAYWNVRPYYEAGDGTRYYGEWITFDPSDFSYFEPTVHTYALTTSPTSNNVQVRGYVMTGTDEVTEQGFEYWANGAAAPQRVAATTSNDVQRVTATGQLMTAVLENLAYNTTYTCRAYALANGKTYYGEEIQFLTPENTTGLFDVFMNNSNAQKVTKYLHNGQLIIDRNGQHYSATGQKLR